MDKADIEKLAAGLPSTVKKAVLMAPFNSKGSGFRRGELASWNAGNGHMAGGKPSLFVRTGQKDFSGLYTLTETGLAVRQYLLENSK